MGEKAHNETILDIARLLPHTLKNFLTGLRLSIDELHDLLAEHNLQDHTDFQVSCSELGKGMERLNRLGGALRELFVIEELAPEPFDLGELVREQLLPWFAEKHSDHFLEYTAGSAPATVLADKRGTELCLQHVLSNAVAGSSGNVTVSLSVAAEENGTSRVVVTVTDRGSGIPGHIQERLFQPFVSGWPNGVGMGLFVTKEFMHRTGGEVQIESEPGKGTTARLFFPADGDAGKI